MNSVRQVAKEFNILHVSDFHISVEPNRRNAAYLFGDLKVKYQKPSAESGATFPRAHCGLHFSSHRTAPLEDLLRLVSDRRNAIDMIVCSGDLATTGFRNDLESA